MTRHFTVVVIICITFMTVLNCDETDLEEMLLENEYVQKRGVSNYVGIPVPGQTVSGLDVFNLYLQSCRPDANRNEIYTTAVNLLSNERGELLARQIYTNLFYNSGDVNVGKLTGKWYKILDSPAIHKSACGITYFKLGQNSTYLSTLTSVDYFRENDYKGDIHSVHGHATKVGPDAGEFLWHTEHASDPCPYLLIKTGPINKDDQRYEYVIFSQFLKYPVMGYARNAEDFEMFYKDEVQKFLESYNFLNRLTTSYKMITFMDFKNCPNDYYNFIDNY